MESINQVKNAPAPRHWETSWGQRRALLKKAVKKDMSGGVQTWRMLSPLLLTKVILETLKPGPLTLGSQCRLWICSASWFSDQLPGGPSQNCCPSLSLRSNLKVCSTSKVPLWEDFFSLLYPGFISHCFNLMGFPGGSVIRNLPVSAGDAGSISGSGRSPGGGNGNPLHYACLENLMHWGAWAAVYRGCKVGHNWATEHKHTHIAFNACPFLPHLLLL